jgi:hypothetical protein
MIAMTINAEFGESFKTQLLYFWDNITLHYMTQSAATQWSQQQRRVPEVLGNMSAATLKLIYLTQWKISVYQRTSAGSVSVESGSGIRLASSYTRS